VSPSIALPEPPPFRARFPWWGGDLQTLATRLGGAPPPVLPTAARLEFAMPDGTGDRLLARLDRPETPRPGAPLVILIHGLTGCETSAYLLSAARSFRDAGYRVLRLNLRGAGPSRPTCGGQYYVGRSQDFRAVMSLLDPSLTADGVVAIGYSLGGAMLLKYLGEEGAAAPLVAAASVCAPIDLSLTCQHMLRGRNRLYHAWLLRQMKRDATAEGARLEVAERAAILGSQTIWDYDEVFIAPRHGFAGAEDYYERCKPLRFLGGIRVPTLVLAAGDDPWIPASIYRGVDWAGLPALRPMLPDGGGHVGFHAADDLRPWSDRVLVHFVDSL